ncbi:MAG TPA: acyl-CoA dehydrogenase family protein [Amycolatopsis sp.]|nr:acyl-CoA dehydrogenase family protein [Amycolatopsis sp.]
MTEDFGTLKRRMRAFIDDEVIAAEPVLEQAGDEGRAALAALRVKAKEQGLWALGHPKEIGGGGLSFMETALLNEDIGRSYFGQKAVGTWSMQDSLMLLENAAPELRERWLEPLVAGEIRSSVGLTEPEVAGSDPTLIRSTAVLEGDEWVINAHKWFNRRQHRRVHDDLRGHRSRRRPAPARVRHHRADRRAWLRGRARRPHAWPRRESHGRPLRGCTTGPTKCIATPWHACWPRISARPRARADRGPARVCVQWERVVCFERSLMITGLPTHSTRSENE